MFEKLGIFIPGIRDFLEYGDFYPGGFREFPKSCFLSQVLGFFESGNFYTGDFPSRGFVIFENPGIFIPRTFSISGDFSGTGIFGDWEFFNIWGFLSMGIFGDWEFFLVGWDSPPKSHL